MPAVSCDHGFLTYLHGDAMRIIIHNGYSMCSWTCVKSAWQLEYQSATYRLMPKSGAAIWKNVATGERVVLVGFSGWTN